MSLEQQGSLNIESVQTTKSDSSNHLINLKPFYVYALIDNSNKKVFYVGKGQDDRIFQHKKEVERGNVISDKQTEINNLMQSGCEVKEYVIGRFGTEEEAFAVESTLIHWVYGKDSLTNNASGHGSQHIRDKDNLEMSILTSKSEEKPYYVYCLISPLDSDFFYVGKGKGARCHQHLKDVYCGTIDSVKKQKMLEIINSGPEPNPLIIGRYATEKEAFAVESVLIHWAYGITKLVNDQSGHGVDTIRPRGHYETLQGIDEPFLNYCQRTKENRERNDISPYIRELGNLVENECDIKFDFIDTRNDRHTMLVKEINGVHLTIACHHTARKAAAVTIQSVDLKQHNRDKVIKICNNSRLEYKDRGRYGRIMPAGTYSDPKVIVEKFRKTLSEVEKVKIDIPK
ncbi:MAG: hypothetical protein ACI8PB_000026 [Desulforhopalus sp.]|jgi:hypothetical protein